MFLWWCLGYLPRLTSYLRHSDIVSSSKHIVSLLACFVFWNTPQVFPWWYLGCPLRLTSYLRYSFGHHVHIVCLLCVSSLEYTSGGTLGIYLVRYHIFVIHLHVVSSSKHIVCLLMCFVFWNTPRVFPWWCLRRLSRLISYHLLSSSFIHGYVPQYVDLGITQIAVAPRGIQAYTSDSEKFFPMIPLHKPGSSFRACAGDFILTTITLSVLRVLAVTPA